MWDGSMMGWMWIWPVLIMAGLLIIGYLTVRLLANGRSTESATSGRASAREILDERYARGEIDEEEYLRRRSGLE